MSEAFSGKDGDVLTADGEQIVGKIIKWEATHTVYKKEFGHNKSGGWQDVVYGIERVEGTIEVKHEKGLNFAFRAGKFVGLQLVTGGDTGRLKGLAGVDSEAVSVVIENGEPVSVTYKFCSKGKWTGPWNDAENEGSASANDSGSTGSVGGT